VTVRQERATAEAERTSRLVTSLFPANVRDRLYQDVEKEKIKEDTFEMAKQNGSTTSEKTRPIADLVSTADSSIGVFFCCLCS